MPSDQQYQRLLHFRVRLREFDRWSRAAAQEQGLTHAQHQLLLAVRGSATPGGPTVGEVAEALFVAHHTASELVDRVQALGLVERRADSDDHRRVHLALTPAGHEVLQRLTAAHVAELRGLATVMGDLSGDL